MNATKALALIRAVGLPRGDYAVFGSGPLLVRGIIEDATDIDILARGAAWEHARATGELVYLPDHAITVASFFDGAITVGDRWAIGSFSVDQLVDSADVIEGLPFVGLGHVRSYKRTAGRPKDLIHLEKLSQWLAAGYADSSGH